MVISGLKGGLGNIMFQIATGVALAKRCNMDYVIDLQWCNFQHKHINEYKDNIFKSIYTNIKVGILHPNTPVINEITFLPYQKLEGRFNFDNYGVFLNGYFQSEKYFEDCADLIRYLFTNNEIINKLKIKYSGWLKDSVSLHVRRGDYLTTADYFPLPTAKYYNSCLAEFPNAKNILVFSDDIPWCKRNLYDKKDRMVFIEGNQDYEDLFLMSLCNNNIMANSSFSWWGAWLNRNPKKKVHAPSEWFRRDKIANWNDIYFKEILVELC